MAPLPDRFKIARPTRAERRASPIAAMAYWDAEGWAGWLMDGARLSQSADRSERASAFAPLTRHPDLDGAKELFNELKASVPEEALMRMEDGLAQCIAGWTSDDGAGPIRFLIELAGHVEGSAPRAALKQMLLKPHNFRVLKDAGKLADAIASVLCKRATSGVIRELLPVLEPLLATSPSAAILVAAREASDDPDGFVGQLRQLSPGLFDRPADDRLWRFAANKLIERAGVDGAVKAVHDRHGPDAQRMYEALKIHRRHEAEKVMFRGLIDTRNIDEGVESFDDKMAQGAMGPILPVLAREMSFERDERSTDYRGTMH